MAYEGRRGWNPASLTAAVAINGGVLALLLLATTTPRILTEPWKPFEAIDVPIDPPPPPIPPEPAPPAERTVIDPAPLPLPYIPPAPLPVPGPRIDAIDTLPPSPPLPMGMGNVPLGTGGAGTAPVATPAPPVLVAASVDPRYRADFQPDYPAFERNQARDGTVVVRVLVGRDGRVAAIERVSATSDAFFDATKRRALSKWRFRPATRDGVAVESWREMTVRFTMEDA